MSPAARDRWKVRAPLLLISAAAWTTLILRARHSSGSPGSMPGMYMGPTTSSAHHSWRITLDHPAGFAVDWLIMVVAMMGPFMIEPVRHVAERSFGSRRLSGVAEFLLAYTGIWVVGGLILGVIANALRAWTPSTAAAAAVVAAAIVWQCSPVEQRCRNQTHVHPELAAFGGKADLSILRFGITRGAWCVGSCWALMLVPLCLTHNQTIAMAAATLWLWTQHLEPSGQPKWRLRPPASAARIIATAAQTTLRELVLT